MPTASSPPFDEAFLERRTGALVAGLFVLVAATAYACVVFPRDQGRIAPIWLANAWVVAALLRLPGRRWPIAAAAGFAGNLLANHLAGDPWLVGGGMSLCNTIEVLLCAGIIRRRCGPNFDIGRVGHLLTLVGAAVAGSLASATAAAGLLGLLSHTDFLRGLAVWVQADTLGLLTLTPALLVFGRRVRTPWAWSQAWTLVVLAVVAWAVFFTSHYPLLFVITAALALPTWRMGLPGAVAGFAIIATLGTIAALTDHGPITVTASADRIVALQIFLIVSYLTSVPLAVARDAGERMRSRLRGALSEARAARAAAEAAAVVKSEFLANMSHELRTPLTSVVGFTRLAAEQPDLNPLTRSYIDRVGEASRALLCAVNDILDFSKLEAGQVTFRPQPVAIGALLRAALDLFTPQAAAKDLILTLDDATPPDLVVTLDPDRLRQVLLNLVGNAVKFTSAGKVTLQARYDEARDELSIAVMDTGPGISPEHLDRLFKRFSQVDGSLTRDFGGTGLGLAICKGIVEAMAGTISVSSQVGQGSRFSFAVRAPRSQAAPPQVTGPAGLLADIGLRVLVTDDHAANRDLVRLFLAGIGAEVTEAADGETAVEIAAQEPFDVILMDLRMPRLDGVGATARIRAGMGPNRTIPILAFTADAEQISAGHLQRDGFAGVVAKPVEPGPLIAAIAAALAPGAHAVASKVG